VSSFPPTIEVIKQGHAVDSHVKHPPAFCVQPPTCTIPRFRGVHFYPVTPRLHRKFEGQLLPAVAEGLEKAWIGGACNGIVGAALAG